jgi:membrane-associated phospholipid phosphatase
MLSTQQACHFLPYLCVRILAFTAFCSIPSTVFAQQNVAPSTAVMPQPPHCELGSLHRCLVDIAKDQAHIFTSPLRIHKQDLRWLVPLVAATGTAYAFDRKTLDVVSTNPVRVNAYRTVSNFTGIYVPVAGIGASFLASMIKHDDHLRETGLLAGEALADTMLFTEMMKFGANRVRPQALGLSRTSGEFWPDGKSYPGGDSFPSGHSASAFAFAHVVASEYSGWKIKLAVYGLAAATAFARVGGREHFPSDVIAGGAIGYLVGGYVFHLHHPGMTHNQLMISPMLGGNGLGVSLVLSRSSSD